MRVAYLGPEGTFTEEALLATWPDLKEEELNPLATIRSVIRSVQSGESTRGLVPIENALEGSVNTTLDGLAATTGAVVITAETIYPITQCLIGLKETDLAQVKYVASHPHASAQCQNFIREHLPNSQILPANSTADAVKLVREHGSEYVAIGNSLAAELYGCTVLQNGIDDITNNETRFVLLAPNSASSAATETATKTSLVFSEGDTDSAGWLVSCLNEFAKRNINLTKIESRPLRQGLGSYMFFIDIEGSTADPTITEAVASLREQVRDLYILGSYSSVGGSTAS